MLVSNSINDCRLQKYTVTNKNHIGGTAKSKAVHSNTSDATVSLEFFSYGTLCLYIPAKWLHDTPERSSVVRKT